MEPSDFKKFENEVEIMLALSGEDGKGHPSIVKLFHYYEDPKRFMLISELCTGGELFSHIEKVIKLEINESALVLKQVLSALKFMHDMNIVHRDLKPENILIDSISDGYIAIKLIDFGTCCKLKNIDLNIKKEGTLSYMAPEVLKLKIPGIDDPNYEEEQDGLEKWLEYTKMSDMWSIGIIAYILVCGEMPFSLSDKPADPQGGSHSALQGFKDCIIKQEDYLEDEK